jgi:hypothetical protein
MTTYYPHRHGAAPSSLVGQFVLGWGDISAPQRWTVLSQRGWTLALHPALPSFRVVTTGGENVGWLLGHAVARDGKFVGQPIVVPSQPSGDATCEEIVAGLSGRFLLLMLAGPNPRMYTDAFAMLAAVFARSARMVASTSSLIPVTDSTPYEVAWIMATDVPYTNAMYPLGLTPRRGVERVLPNHYLDLEQWTLVRRWPKGDLAFDRDPSEAARTVAATASRTIDGIAAAYPVQSPITAGRDSRLMLACSRNVAHQIEFFTAPFPGQLVGWRDVMISKRIAARIGLTHRVLPYRRPRRSDRLEWVQKTAGETGEVNGWRALRTLKQLAADRVALSGWAGDIVRPIYWKGKPSDYVVTVADILAICNVPPLPVFVSRAAQWLASLPTRNAITVFDLLLAEQRGGCWTGVITYAEDGYPRARLAPLCNEEIIRTMMCLPESYRREMVFERDVIALMWPELLEFPFNEQVPLSRVGSLYFRGRQFASSNLNRVRRAIRRVRNGPEHRA